MKDKKKEAAPSDLQGNIAFSQCVICSTQDLDKKAKPSKFNLYDKENILKSQNHKRGHVESILLLFITSAVDTLCDLSIQHHSTHVFLVRGKLFYLLLSFIS